MLYALANNPNRAIGGVQPFSLAEARLARWLLMTSDRMESNEFQITQQSLSNMLGVRREAVNESEKNLQQKHLLVQSAESSIGEIKAEVFLFAKQLSSIKSRLLT